jgi:GNAT superfamily N-acetyltransferase
MSAMAEGEFTIRPMREGDLALAIDWATAEGWNPGLGDAACFATVDPEGFLIGELDGKPAATISCVNYDDHFSFLGFYIVRPDLRGRGYGRKIWDAAIAHAGARVIGLDGVLAQQENYKKSGFQLAYRNVRYGGRVVAAEAQAQTIALVDVPIAAVAASDATVFPASRENFLRAWIATKRHVGHALIRDGKLAAWGVIRPCRQGFKVGPLVADDLFSAATVFDTLIATIGVGDVFLDVPEPNSQAGFLATSRGLSPVFETARMYTGPVREVALQRVFGVTTFELG